MDINLLICNTVRIHYTVTITIGTRQITHEDLCYVNVRREGCEYQLQPLCTD